MRKSAVIAVTGLLVATAAAPACAQEAAAPDAPAEGTFAGLRKRVSRWFENDWRGGWDETSTWRLVSSPGTYHYSRSPEHKQVYMLGLERQRNDGLVVGGSWFRNSFGQPSAYVYVGQRFNHLYDHPQLFAHLTGGVLYGYKPPYQNKVPLNVKGFSPGLVGAIGWQFTPAWSAQVNVLGNSALMFQLTADFR